MAHLIWKSVHEVATATGIAWTDEYLDRCDPYLVWAEASTYPGADDYKQDIAVLVELNEGQTVYDLVHRMNLGEPLGRFIPNEIGWVYPTSFATGIVSMAGLRQLINEVRHRETQRFALQGARADLSSMIRMQFKKVPQPLQETLLQSRPTTDSVCGATYLGILDDGLPLLRLRKSGLVPPPPVHLWDQGWQREGMVINPDNPKNEFPTQNNPYWQPAIDLPSQSSTLVAEGFLYGRVDKTPNILFRPLGDRDEYTARHYVHPAPRQTHGASVLGLMAPWLSTRHSEQVTLPCGVAGLAMVQLPTLTVDDTSGGSLAMRVLDGIRHVLWQEKNDRPDSAPGSPARPTVVNISYGIHGGPHNGSSMFERAAAEALDKNKHLHLVLPMGNAHRAGIHTRRCLHPSADLSPPLKLRVMPDNPRDTFLEIWLPEGAEVEVEIEPPGSKTRFLLKKDEAWVAYEPRDGDPETPSVVHFAGIYPARVADSMSGTMVLIAIGATRVRQPRPQESELAFNPVGANQQPRRTVIAPAGEWQVRLRNVTKDPFEVNAWVQRNDPAPDRLSASRQAWFPDSARPEVRTGQAAPDNTINGVATFTHERLHVIGAMRANGRLSVYSAARAAGSTARKPSAVTVADWSPAVHGILSLGFTQGAVTRLDGTSAACAVYSRALAKQLKEDPTKLPKGNLPGVVEPEFDSGPEDEPSAPNALRGEDVRMFLPFDVEIATRPPR